MEERGMAEMKTKQSKIIAFSMETMTKDLEVVISIVLDTEDEI